MRTKRLMQPLNNGGMRLNLDELNAKTGSAQAECIGTFLNYVSSYTILVEQIAKIKDDPKLPDAVKDFIAKISGSQISDYKKLTQNPNGIIIEIRNSFGHMHIIPPRNLDIRTNVKLFDLSFDPHEIKNLRHYSEQYKSIGLRQTVEKHFKEIENELRRLGK
jgi:hypothetical protein